MKLGLYCHVPFCAVACDFCAFYQQQPRLGDFEQYLAGIETELALTPPDRPADTFFWGGGTPGLLPPEALQRLGTAFMNANKNPPVEWSVELSPGTARPARLAVLRELGVTRISLGVQSFDPATLAALGRRHTPRQIYQAWAWIKEAGFRDTSMDLIFAIPGQDETRWKADLAEAVRLAPEHLSTYCLTLEEDTALYLRLARANTRATEEQEAALYRATWHFLEANGYAQYEISNFARPGHACLHNLHIWGMEEWLGYGPAAASQWHGQRFQNPANLKLWLQGLDARAPIREQVVELTPATLFADALIFGLRKNEGVSPAALARHFGLGIPAAANLKSLITRLAAEGWLLSGQSGATKDETWRLTLEGRLRADAIASEILKLV